MKCYQKPLKEQEHLLPEVLQRGWVAVIHYLCEDTDAELPCFDLRPSEQTGWHIETGYPNTQDRALEFKATEQIAPP